MGNADPHRRIAWAMVVGIAFIGIAKLAGLAKELAMAWRFGSGPVADAYALTFSLASWPVAVWASVAASLIVPVLVVARHEGRGDLAVFQKELIAISVASGIVLGLLVFGVLSVGQQLGWAGLSLSRSAEVREMIAPLSLMVPLGVVSSILATWLIASHRQINTLIDGVPSLTLFVALLLLPSANGAVVAWMTVAGFGVQLVALTLVQAERSRALLPRLGLSSSLWRGIWPSLAVLLVGQAILSLSGVIDQVSVVHLGPSSNATIGYANRLLMLLQGLASLAITRALLPILSNPSYGDATARWTISVRWAWLVFLGGLVIGAIGWLLAPIGVQVLFQRGEFTVDDSVRVVEALRFGLAQIPFYCGGVVLAQYVSATQRYSLFLWGNALNLVVKIAANALLIPAFGVPGAMLASALMYATSMVFLWYFGRPRGGRPTLVSGAI